MCGECFDEFDLLRADADADREDDHGLEDSESDDEEIDVNDGLHISIIGAKRGIPVGRGGEQQAAVSSVTQLATAAFVCCYYLLNLEY